VPPHEGWQLVSARGHRGDAGPAGIQGERGERGPQGESIVGERGPRGERGERGPRGFSIRAFELVPDAPHLMRAVLEDGSVGEPISIATMQFVGTYTPGERSWCCV
jgi:hypothetical protein